VFALDRSRSTAVDNVALLANFALIISEQTFMVLSQSASAVSTSPMVMRPMGVAFFVASFWAVWLVFFRHVDLYSWVHRPKHSVDTVLLYSHTML